MQQPTSGLDIVRDLLYPSPPSYSWTSRTPHTATRMISNEKSAPSTANHNKPSAPSSEPAADVTTTVVGYYLTRSVWLFVCALSRRLLRRLRSVTMMEGIARAPAPRGAATSYEHGLGKWGLNSKACSEGLNEAPP